MPVLTGLPGVAAKSVECEFFNKPKDIRAILEGGKAATTAKANGAINVWADDDGKIRVEAMRHYVKLESQTYDRYSKWVEKWVIKWLKRIA